jgi:hypothetical protein
VAVSGLTLPIDSNPVTTTTATEAASPTAASVDTRDEELLQPIVLIVNTKAMNNERKGVIKLCFIMHLQLFIPIIQRFGILNELDSTKCDVW